MRPLPLKLWFLWLRHDDWLPILPSSLTLLINNIDATANADTWLGKWHHRACVELSKQRQLIKSERSYECSLPSYFYRVFEQSECSVHSRAPRLLPYHLERGSCHITGLPHLPIHMAGPCHITGFCHLLGHVAGVCHRHLVRQVSLLSPNTSLILSISLCPLLLSTTSSIIFYCCTPPIDGWLLFLDGHPSPTLVPSTRVVVSCILPHDLSAKSELPGAILLPDGPAISPQANLRTVCNDRSILLLIDKR
jgi:hypothetical protein